MEIDIIGVMSVYDGAGLLILGSHIHKCLSESSKLRSGLLGLVLTDLGQICAGGHIADGGHGLQLGRTLIYSGNPCIAVDPLDGILLHIAGASVNLNGIVCVLVTVLAGHHLQHGSEHIGVALILHRMAREAWSLAFITASISYTAGNSMIALPN